MMNTSQPSRKRKQAIEAIDPVTVVSDADKLEVKTGYIKDYISGTTLKATPEEVEAVQVFARRLVEDYGYPKESILTRPQHRVRKSPSDNEKTYPIDIAVFRGNAKTEDDLYLVIECKKKNSKEGVAQLKLYLDMSAAEMGVWFNGNDHVYLRKLIHSNGSRTYDELPNIPRHGQRPEDIGYYRRSELKKPSNLKAVFKDIRNHLAGNVTGITRDESLAQEIINILFCKIYDELHTKPADMVAFRCGIGEGMTVVEDRVMSLFDKVKKEYQDVFSSEELVHLDAASLVYVVGELQNYSITEADRDAVGDAFEVFIGPALRGSEGQFFTPRNVVRMAVEILDPDSGEMIIDPACGSGGFLIVALEHVWKKIEAEAVEKGWTDVQLDRRKREIASRCFRGIDKDSFLAKVTKAYMALIGDGRGGVFCENTLLPPSDWGILTHDKIRLGQFDVILTNPPFGAKIPIKGAHVLSQYDLAHRWRKNKETGTLEKCDGIADEQPPQILFLERCLQLLKPGGRMGIVLPESIFGMPTYEHVVNYLQSKTIIRGIVSMPEALFKTSGKGGTHAKVCVVFVKNVAPHPKDDYETFMGDVKWCGHDSRGNPTLRKDGTGNEVLLDDVPLVAARFKKLMGGFDAKTT